VKRSDREGPRPDKLSVRIRSALQGRSRRPGTASRPGAELDLTETVPSETLAPGHRPPPAPREWNLWDLERRAREPGGYAIRDAEWAALFIHLREFATAEGTLPKEFDELVRQSFAELIQAA
jgi:hypothetical protein